MYWTIHPSLALLFVGLGFPDHVCPIAALLCAKLAQHYWQDTVVVPRSVCTQNPPRNQLRRLDRCTSGLMMPIMDTSLLLTDTRE